jgi:hypothetical protein
MPIAPPLRALTLAFACAAAALGAALPAAAAETKRFGIEGMLLEYDEARSVFKIKVTRTKVSGGFGTGGIAGKPPSGIEKGQQLEFAVVPEGSVLRRTVIKGEKGGGLDTTGTKEGFKRAVAVIPRDREVVLSFEENAPPKEGAPPYVLKMVQIRLSPEEIAERLREAGIDPDELPQEEE